MEEAMKKSINSIFIVLLFFFFSNAEEIKKVVIDFRSGDIKSFEGYILSGLSQNIQYYREKLEDLKVVVVIHGNGYKFFIKDLQNSPYQDDRKLMEKQKEFKERLENLVRFYGVKFEICEAGMKARGISMDSLYPFVKPIYSALTGLVEWQQKGYAYILIE